jgi:beta-galactosidase/beta-glucuronidase
MCWWSVFSYALYGSRNSNLPSWCLDLDALASKAQRSIHSTVRLTHRTSAREQKSRQGRSYNESILQGTVNAVDRVEKTLQSDGLLDASGSLKVLSAVCGDSFGGVQHAWESWESWESTAAQEWSQ